MLGAPGSRERERTPRCAIRFFAPSGTFFTANGNQVKPPYIMPLSDPTQDLALLADGNLISRRASTLTYRDSAGRTRQETRDINGDVLSIHINDAVEGTRFVISLSTKTATKIGLHKDLRKHIDEISEKARAMA